MLIRTAAEARSTEEFLASAFRTRSCLSAGTLITRVWIWSRSRWLLPLLAETVELISVLLADGLNLTTMGTVDPAGPATVGVGVVVSVCEGVAVHGAATIAVAVVATVAAAVIVEGDPGIAVPVAAMVAVVVGVVGVPAVAAAVRVGVLVVPAVNDGNLVGDAAVVAAGVAVFSAPPEGTLMAVSANSGRAGKVVTPAIPTEIRSAIGNKLLRWVNTLTPLRVAASRTHKSMPGEGWSDVTTLAGCLVVNGWGGD